MNLDATTILAERMRRQRLADPLDDPDQYLDLFRSLQPVSTIYFTRPGDPPSLTPRTRFDDRRVADRLRGRGTIVKGRFLGGGIGYVLADDLATYANAFRRPLPRLNETQQIVLNALTTAGPLTPRQIREETGLLSKHISPILQRLQQAFLIFEDQTDCDWDRPWSSFASEWPDVTLADREADAALARVLVRFLHAHVFATERQLRDWTRLPARRIRDVLAEMAATGAVAPRTVEGMGEGWMCSDDTPPDVGCVPTGVFMLHMGDMLVRSHSSELKRRFAGEEVLQYLLIDGQFRGAVLGHWRIRNYDVDDIAVELPPRQRNARRDEILAAVHRQYRQPASRILRYAGRKLPKKLQ